MIILPLLLRKFQRFALAITLFLAFQVAAFAATSLSEIKSNVEILLQGGKASEAWLLLEVNKDSFPEDAEFDYLLGVTALQMNQPELALPAFERAVLLQPGFAGAWVDLAICYYRLGDAKTAKQLLTHVEENFSPPEAIKVELNKAKVMVGQAALLNEWHGEVALLGGHVKNANYGIASTNLQLTSISDGIINVILSPDYKPRSDNALELRAGATKRINHASGAYSDVQLGMRSRQYGTENDQDFIDLAGNWTYVSPLRLMPATDSVISLTARRVMMDGRGLGAFFNIATGLRKYYGRCTVTPNLEFEKRLYEGDGQYDADIPWLGVGLDCSRDKYSMAVNYRYGFDQAHGNRPGGNTGRQELMLQTGWQINPSLHLRGTVYYINNQDKEGYSELLEYNAKRYTHRLGERVQLNWLLPYDPKQRLSLQIEFENTDNRSNIAISRFEDTQVFMGLHYKLF